MELARLDLAGEEKTSRTWGLEKSWVKNAHLKFLMIKGGLDYERILC